MGVFAIGTLALAVNVFVGGLFLWIGAKLTGVDVRFVQLVLISLIAAALGLIPLIGGILGIVVMFVLICTWADASFFPDAVLMVVVANIASFLTGMALLSALA